MAAPRTLSLEQKRDFIRRAFDFLDEQAGQPVRLHAASDTLEPVRILCDLMDAVGVDGEWGVATAALLEQVA